VTGVQTCALPISRQHILALAPAIRQALREAGLDWSEVDLVAATAGPGLAGSLLVGLNAAKAAAWARGLPLVSVNHLEGHIYANWLLVGGAPETPPPPFPLICLNASGGHTDLVLMENHGRYRRLGRTRDDAAGEAFDKAARILGLGYPGGPAVQRAAQAGNPKTFPLPRAWLKGSYDFSFSGVKTAVLHLARRLEAERGRPLSPDEVAAIAAAFQESVADVLATKTCEAAREHGARHILLAGGVAANLALRQRLAEAAPVPFSYPPPALCTDNAAMIAACGYFRFLEGSCAGWDLDVAPNLRLAVQE
jgi:N6-L-threonylcarbamoyladenine synthase